MPDTRAVLVQSLLVRAIGNGLDRLPLHTIGLAKGALILQVRGPIIHRHSRKYAWIQGLLLPGSNTKLVLKITDGLNQIIYNNYIYTSFLNTPPCLFILSVSHCAPDTLPLYLILFSAENAMTHFYRVSDLVGELLLHPVSYIQRLSRPLCKKRKSLQICKDYRPGLQGIQTVFLMLSSLSRLDFG